MSYRQIKRFILHINQVNNIFILYYSLTHIETKQNYTMHLEQNIIVL